MGIKLKKRFVKQPAWAKAKYGFRPHWVYDWESELFWGAEAGGLQAAKRANAFYMNAPGYLKTAKYEIRLKAWLSRSATERGERPV